MKSRFFITAALLATAAQAQQAPKPEQLIKWRQSAYQVVAWNAGRVKTNVDGTYNKDEVSAPPPPPFTFFVTSVGAGNGANYGGVEGADAHCQKLAAAAGTPFKSWKAYLSTQGANAVNARDRIGKGPWTNMRGQAVARDVVHLHGDTVELAQLGSNLTRNTALTEKGERPKAAGDTPNEHDILTGSTPDGRAYPEGADKTCRNYTSGAEDGSVQLGHFDRTGGGNASWNSAHGSRGCSQPKLVSSGGAGLLYCFAAN